MNVNKQHLFLLLSVFFIQISSLSAQLEMKLQLIDDHKWGVFVKPKDVQITSETITGSGQVTVVMPSDFAWSSLESKHGLWSTLGGGVVSSPPENPGRNYVSFGLVSAEPTHPIPVATGTETLLFTFQGTGSCPEFLYLIDCGTPNQADPFCPPNSEQSNPGNDLSVIEFGGMINYFNYSDNYAPFAWDCHDNDNDGIPNAFEDTNGNGIFDSGDASDLNGDEVQLPEPHWPQQQAHLPGYVMGLKGQHHSSEAHPFNEASLLVSDRGHATFDLFPNPASEVLNLQVNDELLTVPAMVHLMNSQGVVLQKIQLEKTNSQQVDISDLPAGSYVIAIEDGSGFSERKRFVKN